MSSGCADRPTRENLESALPSLEVNRQETEGEGEGEGDGETLGNSEQRPTDKRQMELFIDSSSQLQFMWDI